MPKLTKSLLIDLAGWQAVKQARTLVAAGSVLRASLQAPDSAGQPLVVNGLVQEGRKRHSCGLIVRSETDADNLCNCPSARRDGQICAHSIAAALQAIESEVGSSPSAHVSGALGLSRSQVEVEQGDAPPALDIAEIPTRIPVTLSKHPTDPNRALLSRPPLPNHQFVTLESNLLLRASESNQAIPTNLSQTPHAFRANITPLLADAATEASLETDRDWLRLNADHLHCMFHVECLDGLIDSLRIVPGVPEISLSLEGSLNRIDLKLVFEYPPDTATNPTIEQRAQSRLTHAEISSRSSTSSSREASEAIRNPHKTTVTAFIRGENAILDFYAGALDQILAESEWHVQIGERFARLTADIEKVRPRIQSISSGTDWLNFGLEFSTDNGEGLPEIEIRRLLETGQSGAKLSSGRRAAIDRRAISDLYQTFEDASPEQTVAGQGMRSIDSSQKFYVQETIANFTKNSGKQKTTPTPSPRGLEATLRPYQIDALKWLHARVSTGHGAILADEMGLGKTVQTLAVIAALDSEAIPVPATDPLSSARESGGAGHCHPPTEAPQQAKPTDGGNQISEERAPILIIAPTSLIPTWKREIQKFLPSYRILTLHGPSRHRDLPNLAATQIVITSYGALVRDIDRYPPMEFALVVADEASYIKNPRTKTSKAAFKVRAKARLALTGTPVENSIQDVWSIMQFAVPGYLGRRDDFISRHASSDPDGARHLRRRLAPFLLRRTKLQVAADLPDKIERVIYCELTSAQRQVYETLLREGRAKLHKISSTNDWQSSSLDVLTLLLRLRQTCCDLRILRKNTPEKPSKQASNDTISPEKASAKLAALDTLLKAALPAGHRVLIFSQFVSMLDQVREQLDAAGHQFAYLDGSTSSRERERAVDSFQAENGDIPIFLISLKAGGYGLTLTAADTVVHLDPWWNPAVEAQATDRAHRIGQTRPVTAYKLITTGTVEEKILRLQDRKRNLIDTALDDHRPLMRSLTQDDVEFILS